MFTYFEGFRNTEGQTDTRTVLSLAERAGDFSGSSAIRDPLSGLPFAGNIIPADQINPIARQILDAYIPPPNGANNVVVRAPNLEDTRQQFGVRLDFKLESNHNLLARYIVGHTKGVSPLGASNVAPAANTALATLQDFMASDTWIQQNNRINVVRASVNRIDAKPTVSSGLDPRDLGFAYSASHPASAGLPFISIPGFFTTGDSQQQFASRVNNVIAIADDFTWVSGLHAFRFGGELRREQIKASYIFDPNGDYTFNGQYSGNAAADFLLGYPVVFRQATGDPNLDGASWVYALYAQDQYRVTPRITLNYGVRYEVFRPFAESRDRLNAFHPGQQSMVFPNAPTGLVSPGDEGVPRGTYPTDTNTVAPRVAAIWDPHGSGRMSVRGAWGCFTTPCPGKVISFRAA